MSNITVHRWGLKEIERKRIRSGKKIYDTNCECKILFLLYTRKEEFNLDYFEYNYTKTILGLINSSNIDRIISFDDKTKSVFGLRGKCGVVILHSKSRKLQRKLKRKLLDRPNSQKQFTISN